MLISVSYISLFALGSQLMSEKVGGAEGTKLDEDFKDLERVLNAFHIILTAHVFKLYCLFENDVLQLPLICINDPNGNLHLIFVISCVPPES